MAEFDVNSINYKDDSDCKEVLKRFVEGVFDCIEYAIEKKPVDETGNLIFGPLPEQVNLRKVWGDLGSYEYEKNIINAIGEVSEEKLKSEGLKGSQLQTKMAFVEEHWIVAFPDSKGILQTRKEGTRFVDTGPGVVPKGKVTIRVLFDYLKIPLSSLLDMLGVGKAISELADLLGLVVKRLNDEGGTPVRREGQNPVTVPVPAPRPKRPVSTQRKSDVG